jgi:uncharacterized protein YjfI (DUF2170 family)
VRILALVILFLFSLAEGFGQRHYWQQQVNYTIDVTLNDEENTLTGFEKIEYINNSPDTLRFIFIHLWPNAYKNDRTAFSEQLLKNDRTDFYLLLRKRKILILSNCGCHSHLVQKNRL